jgi:hypothetical protein
MTMRARSALAMLLVCRAAAGQVPAVVVEQTARQRFDEALTYAQVGNLEQALAEFQAAYAADPRFPVLFNIGHAASMLGRPVEAVGAFERYLVEGVGQIDETRRATAETLLASNRKRIGQVRIEIAGKAPGRLWLDGDELEPARLGTPISLKVGEHTLIRVANGAAPTVRRFLVSSDALTEVVLTPPATIDARPTLLEISCALPDVDVELGGAVKLRTPLKSPLLVSSGELRVRFSRAGYVAVERVVTVAAGAVTRLACDMRREAAIQRALLAKLTVRSVPANAQVWLDGLAFRGDILPAGSHELRLEGEGFVPLRRSITLAPGQNLSLEATLQPTAAARERRLSAQARRRGLAYALGGSGLAMLAGSGAVYLWNDGRYRDWSQGASDRPRTVASLQRADDATVALAVSGVALVIGASILLLSSAGEP